MNYNAPTRIYRPKEKKPTLFQVIREVYSLVKLFFALLIQFPLFILNLLGLNIPNIILSNIPLCSICTIGAFVSITSSVGVGLGVGVGVGINCAKTLYVSTNNSTSNGTIIG